MSITTSVETISVPDAGPAPLPDSQPELLRRERAALREILRLVSERAGAEAKVEETRATAAATADAEYQKARRNRQEKFEQSDRDARSADVERRRAIVEETMRGEAEAKNEFASSSRKIAQDFDRAREGTRNDANRGKSEVAGNFEKGQAKAVQEHSAGVKPILDLMRMADGHRGRLATIAADYAKVKLNTEAPIPSEENYSKFDDPVDELFNRLSRMDGPLKLLESLFIPKVLKGQNEIWIYVVVILLMVAAAVLAGGKLPEMVVGAAAGAAVAVLLRIWLVKLSRAQLERLYVPLMHSLADSDNLALYCRGLVDDRLKDARQVLSARREEDLKKVEANYAKAFRAAEAQRDERLRKINEVYATRMVERADGPATQSCATPSRSTTG